MYSEIYHQWGSDLMFGPTGDLAVSNGTVQTQQRVLRRLLTDPGEYIWQLDYGAGLAQFVGGPVSPLQIQAVIRSQIFKEAAVSADPEPEIDVLPVIGGSSVAVTISYADADTGESQVLTFSVKVRR